MEEVGCGWTSCFISSHSSEAGWRLGQKSRTSKTGKGADGRMIFVLAPGRVCCQEVWTMRLGASIPGLFPWPDKGTERFSQDLFQDRTEKLTLPSEN